MALGSKKPRWRKQEKETAERIGGKVSKASGAGYQKGDVRKFNLTRVECKTSKGRSFRITSNIIDKLEKDCLGANEIPVISIELENGKRKCFILPDYALELLLGLEIK